LRIEKVMEIRDSEVKSGAFILLAVVALVILLFSVGNLTSYFRPTVEYHTYLSNVQFLKAHDPVTYGGMRVGEIRKIELADDRFGQLKIIIQVGEEIEVKEDSTLVLKQDGILGSRYLEITPGGAASKRAGAGAELDGVLPPGIMDLGGRLEGPLRKADLLLENLNKIFGSPGNQKNVEELLSRGRELLVDLRDEVQKIGAEVRGMGEKADETMAEVQEIIRENHPTLSTILKNLNGLSASLVETADHLDGLILRGNDLVIQNNRNIYETIRNLRDAAYHLEQGARRIRADPSILIFGAGETPEELRRADETEIRLQGRTRRYDKEAPR